MWQKKINVIWKFINYNFFKPWDVIPWFFTIRSAEYPTLYLDSGDETCEVVYESPSKKVLDKKAFYSGLYHYGDVTADGKLIPLKPLTAPKELPRTLWKV